MCSRYTVAEAAGRSRTPVPGTEHKSQSNCGRLDVGSVVRTGARGMAIAADLVVDKTDYAGDIVPVVPRGAIERVDLSQSKELDLDARRRMLEARITATTARLHTDITRVKALVSRARRRAKVGLVRVALVAGGLLALGLITVLARRRARRIRVTWR